jgi:hypothetical protein
LLAAAKASTSPPYYVGAGYSSDPYTAASVALAACGQFPTNLAGKTVVIKPNLLAPKAYVGVPLARDDGSLFGTLCGIDPAPQPQAIIQASTIRRSQYLRAVRLGQLAKRRDRSRATTTVWR